MGSGRIGKSRSCSGVGRFASVAGLEVDRSSLDDDGFVHSPAAAPDGRDRTDAVHSLRDLSKHGVPVVEGGLWGQYDHELTSARPRPRVFHRDESRSVVIGAPSLGFVDQIAGVARSLGGR